MFAPLDGASRDKLSLKSAYCHEDLAFNPCQLKASSNDDFGLVDDGHFGTCVNCCRH